MPSAAGFGGGPAAGPSGPGPINWHEGSVDIALGAGFALALCSGDPGMFVGGHDLLSHTGTLKAGIPLITPGSVIAVVGGEIRRLIGLW